MRSSRRSIIRTGFPATRTSGDEPKFVPITSKRPPRGCSGSSSEHFGPVDLAAMGAAVGFGVPPVAVDGELGALALFATFAGAVAAALPVGCLLLAAAGLLLPAAGVDFATGGAFAVSAAAAAVPVGTGWSVDAGGAALAFDFFDFFATLGAPLSAAGLGLLVVAAEFFAGGDAVASAPAVCAMAAEVAARGSRVPSPSAMSADEI
jgi:hypothetical protein